MKYATTDRLSDVELVACVLGRKTLDEACTRLATVLTTDGWMGGAPLAEVAREYGTVGPKSVARLEAAIELGRRTMAANAAREATTVSTPEDVVALMKPSLVGRGREIFICICLDTKNRVRKIVELSVGSLNASIVHPRELFKEAVMVSAASVVVCHQHPSGDPTPSGADIQLTRRLVKAGDVLGISVLDHVVIGGDEHASLRDLGLM
ncbi:MAG: DNA repair protein RadC [Actinomycetota bacterium]|jgi:DNA repair protein RadC|nr:DNA repair protein RadC [Actinomycetota bacterium]